MAKGTIKIGGYVFRQVKAVGKCHKGSLAMAVGQEGGVMTVKEAQRVTVDNLEEYCVYAGKYKGKERGQQREYRFPNGYGGSLIRYKIGGKYATRTFDEDEWQLAVIKYKDADDKAGKLVYNTPVANDVLGYLDEYTVKKILLEIAHLQVADDGSVIVPKTMVVFRVYSEGEVIALFPCIEARPFCGSYMTIGQHGAAEYRVVVRQTTPATPEEAMPLADELKGLGYSLSVRQRAPSAQYRAKWLAMGND